MVEKENNELIWTGTSDKVKITDDGTKVKLKYNDHIVIADASSNIIPIWNVLYI